MAEETVSTKEKLARELEKADAPLGMIRRARAGTFDDYESNHDTPIVNLVKECQQHGLIDLAYRAKNGEFDATKAESDAWFEREGQYLLKGK